MFFHEIWQVASHVLMGISHGAASPKDSLSLTPLGHACSKQDLTAIHEILEDTGYKDDEGIANEVGTLFILLSILIYSDGCLGEITGEIFVTFLLFCSRL